MSHYHAEIVVPTPTSNRPTPTSNRSIVEAAVKEALEPFGPDGPKPKIWDWWRIGGRYSGDKLISTLDPDRVQKFWKSVEALNITVSPIKMGKPRLNPASQSYAIDQIWRRHFPELDVTWCPLFEESPPVHQWDIRPLQDVPDTVTAHYMGLLIYVDGRWRMRELFQRFWWTGASWQDSAWDGTLGEFRQALEKSRASPPDNSLVVTLDFHN